MNPALSRRVARIMAYDPILSLEVSEQGQLAYTVEAANEFGDLPERFQQLVLAAEATRERILAEVRGRQTEATSARAEWQAGDGSASARRPPPARRATS